MRLTQAVLQLAANAVRFTTETDSIRIGTAVAGPSATLWVDDTGPGVSPDDAERIFQRFGRGRGARSGTADSGGEAGGTGLGLAIVQAIAHAHGGNVQLVARPGPGARFVITIPAVPAERVTEQHAER